MDHLNAVEPGCVSTITGGYVFTGEGMATGIRILTVW